MEGPDVPSAELELEVELIRRFENRLENIEQKIDILEKPIQETLLDIQEQITSYYSPSRRAAPLYEELERGEGDEASDVPSADSDVPSADSDVPVRGRGLTSPIGAQGPGEEGGLQSESTFSSVSKVKQVTLEDLRTGKSESPEEESDQ